MLRIRKLKDVVDWGLCVGCGACSSLCDKRNIVLKNFNKTGIRPTFTDPSCDGCTDCLAFCPGVKIESKPQYSLPAKAQKETEAIGPALKVWEGHASDKSIRFAASSGGAVTALALYCLEKENMKLVVHTGMNPERPWENATVVSKKKTDLLKHCGSRYQTSSPCDALDVIEKSSAKAVFIGRPCDVAAVMMARKVRPALDKNLGLVLTFFCAGTPSTFATEELMRKMGVEKMKIKSLKYRGSGWPGGFTAETGKKKETRFMPYEESWAFLTKFRPFRCQICPDGLGELADVSCGDAWHRFSHENVSDGLSLVLARTEEGRRMVEKALKAKYLTLKDSSRAQVITAQGLVERRRQIFGRLIALRSLLIPVTRFEGFYLLKNWLRLNNRKKIVSVFGTSRRIVSRGLWHKNEIR